MQFDLSENNPGHYKRVPLHGAHAMDQIFFLLVKVVSAFRRTYSHTVTVCVA
jgi:hypothetical protein